VIALGLDPGKDGAIVLLDGASVVAQVRIATLLRGARWHAAHPAVTGWIRSAVVEHHPEVAALELYAGRPGEGRGSMLTVGVGWGLCLGALSALGVPVLTPTSATWTRDLLRGVAGEGKQRAICWASQAFFGLDLTPGRVATPHSGLADAACLARWAQGGR
jgi:hypothetical protein